MAVEAKTDELLSLRSEAAAARTAAEEFATRAQKARQIEEESRAAETHVRAELETKCEEADRLTVDCTEARARLARLQESLPKTGAVGQATSKNVALHIEAENQRQTACEAEVRAKQAEEELAKSQQAQGILEATLEAKITAAKDLEIAKSAAEAMAASSRLAAEEASERISAAESAAAMARGAEVRIRSEVEAKAVLVMQLKANLAASQAVSVASPARSRSAAAAQFEPTPPKRRRLSKATAPMAAEGFKDAAIPGANSAGLGIAPA